MVCINTPIFSHEYKHPTKTTLALSQLCKEDDTDYTEKNEWGKKKDILKYVYCRHVTVSNCGIELNKQFEKIKKLQFFPLIIIKNTHTQ